MEQKSLRRRNWLLFLFAVFLWALNWSAMKIGLSFVSPMIFVFHRYMISAVALCPVLLLLRKGIPRNSDNLGKVVLFSLMFFSGMIMMTIGLAGQSSGVTAVLTHTEPLFIFCLAIPFLKEKITVIKLFGIIMGFLGVTVFFSSTIGSFNFNSAFIIISAAFVWAVAKVCYARYVSDVDSLVANFFHLCIGAVLLAILSGTTRSSILPSHAAYLWVLLYTSAVLAVGPVIYLFLLKEEEATVLSGSSFIIPAVALFFGWQLLGESIGVNTMLGLILIIGGVCLVNVKSSARRKKP